MGPDVGVLPSVAPNIIIVTTASSGSTPTAVNAPNEASPIVAIVALVASGVATKVMTIPTMATIRPFGTSKEVINACSCSVKPISFNTALVANVKIKTGPMTK